MKNGQIPASSLTTLLNGQRLLNSVAVSVKTLVLVGELEGVKITTPTGGDRGISGYRDLARQSLFLAASKGNRAAAIRCNIDPTMRTNVGSVGAQSHGWADRIDLLFNGRSPNTSDLALVARYGGVQEFGDDDRNHMWFKKSVHGPTESDKNRIVARFLNKLSLGKRSGAETDGKWPARSNLSWLLQEYGSERKGWYPQPRYKIDGERGPRTIWVRDALFSELWNS